MKTIEAKALSNVQLLAEHERVGTNARALFGDLIRMASEAIDALHEESSLAQMVKDCREALKTANRIIETAQSDTQCLMRKHPELAQAFNEARMRMGLGELHG